MTSQIASTIRYSGRATALFVGITLLTFTIGCSALSTDLAASGRVTVEASISESLTTAPSVFAADGDLVISGRLGGNAFREPGHIDVTVVAPDGRVLYDARINYRHSAESAEGTPAPESGRVRRSPRYRQFSYAVRFPGLPPGGSKVKVRYDSEPHEPIVLP